MNPLRHLHVHNRKVSHTPVSRDEDLAITKTQRPFAFDQWELETSAPERKSFPGHIRFKLQYSLAFALRGPPGSGSTRAPQCHERSLCPSNGELKGRDACRSCTRVSVKLLCLGAARNEPHQNRYFSGFSHRSPPQSAHVLRRITQGFSTFSQPGSSFLPRPLALSMPAANNCQSRIWSSIKALCQRDRWYHGPIPPLRCGAYCSSS